MLRSSLLNAWRSITRNYLLGAIKIVGSTVGILCFTAAYFYYLHETSYDQFPDAQRVYRFVHRVNLPEGMEELAVTSAPTGPSIKDRFPEVEDYCRIMNQPMFVRSDMQENGFNEQKFVFADSSFLTFFPFELKYRTSEPPLSKPYTIISAALAKKYFGDIDPIGKTLISIENIQFTVTGVLADRLQSSHLGQLDFIASFSSLEPMGKNKAVAAVVPGALNIEHKGYNFYYTYLLTAPNTNPDDVVAKFPAYIEDFRGKGRSERLKPTLQSMSDIHLHSNLRYEIDQNGSVGSMNIFLLIGTVILLISNINFINISTSEFIKRSKNVGIRKVLGTSRMSLIFSFTIETMLVFLISTLLSVVLLYALMPYFSFLVSRQIAIDIGVLATVLLPLWLLCSLLSSLYPAIYITQVSPADVVRMRFSMGKSVGLTRNGLVFIQLAVSVVLVSASLIIYSQLDYLIKKDLGFDSSRLLQINTLGADELDLETFKKEIKRLPGVVDAASSSSAMGVTALGFTVSLPESADEDRRYRLVTHFVDPEYVSTMKVNLIDGRFLQRDIAADSVQNIVINEAAEDVIFGGSGLDRKIIVPNMTGSGSTTMNVVGVVKNFNHASLHNAIEPLMFMWRPANFKFLFVRYESGATEASREMEKQWKTMFPGSAFEYVPIEQAFERLYSAERSLKDLVVVFALIAVGIAAIGLFGTALFQVEQRTREFGIRKVLGADSSALHLQFSKPFALLLTAAFLVGAPISWMYGQDWLDGFPYRTQITPVVFIIAFLVIAGIIAITLVYHYRKLSKLNAVDVLKEM